MRAVRLTNGRSAIPFRVEHLLTRGDLENMLAWTVRRRNEELPHLTKTQIRERIRETLNLVGVEAPAYWQDNVVGAVDRDRIEEWAQEHVERVFGPMLRAALGG